MRELKYLAKKLEMKAGFLNPRCPFVYLNEDEDGSYWNFEQNFISLGIKTILEKAKEKLEKLATLLLAHEVSHTLNTDTEAVEKVDYPFPILNILEDARIEDLISKKGFDFHELHQFCYEAFYTEDEMFKNPYNVGVLLRWRKWRVKTRIEKPDGMTEKEFGEFVQDWEDAIEKSIRAKDTEEVVRIGKALYEKWRKVFGEVPPKNTCTGVETDKEDFGKKENGEIVEGKSLGKLGREPEEVKDSPYLFEKKPMWEWNEEWIRKTVAELRRYLRMPSYTEREYTMTGRRINPKRAENLLPPFKREETITYSIDRKKILIVIDGSGSMAGKPYYWACHTARVLSEIFQIDVVITTGCSLRPIEIKNLDALRYFNPYDYENYASLEDMPYRYEFTLFLTDAMINQEDWRYIENLKCKKGAGYVNSIKDTAIEDALRKVFHKYFYAKPENVAIEIGLYLKRLLTVKGG